MFSDPKTTLQNAAARPSEGPNMDAIRAGGKRLILGQRILIGVAMATVVTVFGGVAWSAFGPDSTDPIDRPNPSPTATPSPSASPRPPSRPIQLKPFPAVGVAVAGKGGVVLIDLEGQVVETLPGFEITGNPGAPGIWLRQGRQFFRLAPKSHRLKPVTRKLVGYDEGGVVPIPPPPGAEVVGVGVVGHWRYSFASETGVTLAQWSGECEVPTAYWIHPSGEPEIITGGTELSLAPESIVMGWAPTGEAVVDLGWGYCGHRGDPPGVYLFSAPGEGRLIFRTETGARTDMWP